MKRHWQIVGTVLAAMVTASGAWAAPKATWVPNPTLLAQLGPVQKLGDFQLQPPAGYDLQPIPAPRGITAEAWVSGPRPDGSRHLLTVISIKIPAGAWKHTLTEVADKKLAAVRSLRSNWKQSPSETGTINGLTFIRTYWRGAEKETGQMMHGFLYAARDGGAIILLSSEDLETYDTDDALPLMEASALTIKRASSKTLRRTSRR